MVLVLYSLEDKNYCCLSTNFLSRHRQDIPDFRLFTVTRCACDFDQTANIGICISSSGGHYHNWPGAGGAGGAFDFLLLYRPGETQTGLYSCLGFQLGLYHVFVALRVLRSTGFARLLFYLSREGSF